MNAQDFAFAIASADGNDFYHEDEIEEHEEHKQFGKHMDCRICYDI